MGVKIIWSVVTGLLLVIVSMAFALGHHLSFAAGVLLFSGLGLGIYIVASLVGWATARWKK
jgi:hypothetical protein